MKSYKITLLFSMMLAIFASCSEDFLQEDLLTQDSSERQYSTVEGLERLVVGCYATGKIWYGKEYAWDFTTVGTDIYDYGQQHPQQYQYTFTGDFNSLNSRLVVQWVELYKGINACNDAISIMEGKRGLIPNPFDEEMTAKRLSEVKFLRALYNYLIVETWGGNAILRTEPILSPLATAENASMDEFYKVIESDLDFAVENLTDDVNTDASEFGRVNKLAAQALRARIYLTMAYHAENGLLTEVTANDYYTKARTDADAVIASGKFDMWDQYADLWDLANNDNNPECIWAVHYSRTTYASIGVPESEYTQYQQDGDKPYYDRDGGHHGHLMFGIQYDVMPGMVRDMDNGRPFRRYFPTAYLINAFNDDVDERFYDSFKTTWYCNDPEDTYNVSKVEIEEEFTPEFIAANPPLADYDYVYTVKYTNMLGQSVLTDSLLYRKDDDGALWVVGPKFIRTDVEKLYRRPKLGNEGISIFAEGDTAIHFTKEEYDDADQLVNVSAGYYFHNTLGYWVLDYSNMYTSTGASKSEDLINDAETVTRNIGFELHKFWDNERDAANGDGSTRGGRDSYVMRLPEMYLISSEASWKLGEAGVAYNKLLPLADKRAKEGVSGAQLLAGYNINSGGDLSLDFYLDERAREFAGEQMRWFDLRRTGTFVDRMHKYAGNAQARNNVTEKHVVRPIPQSQVDFLENKGDFKTNGY